MHLHIFSGAGVAGGKAAVLAFILHGWRVVSEWVEAE